MKKKNTMHFLRGFVSIRRSVFGIPVIAGLFLLFSTNGWSLTLTDLDITSSSHQKIELKLSFDENAPTPEVYSIEKPARIVVDLPGSASKMKKYREVGAGGISHITTLQTPEKTRMILNLKKLPVYQVRRQGHFVYIVLGDSASEVSPVVVPKKHVSDAPRDRMHEMKKLPNSVSAVDFSRRQDGAGNLVIDLSNKHAAIDVKESGSRIIIQLKNTTIQPRLRNRLNVVDFATPVQFVDLKQLGESAFITVNTQDHFEYLVYQSGNQLTVSVMPVDPQDEALGSAKVNYTGDKLSLNFQNIEVRSILRIIADFTKKNLVASDTVRGSITLRLQDVPWDQALDLILKAKGLGKRENGNVIVVAPAQEIAARERQDLENSLKLAQLAPLYTEVFRINYHDADALFKLFKKDRNSPTIFSKRGEVIVDTRSNSIILKETQDKLTEFRELLKILDVPVRQVLIEARIVNADDGFSHSLGVKWSGGAETGSDTKLDGDVVTDLSATGSNVSRLSFGFIHDNTILNLELSAAESSSKVEIVSRPKVITSDKATAIIKSGEEIPYQEASSSGATSTAFKTAALSLEVTPQITPDGRVIMKLKVNNDAAGKEVEGQGPAITTQSVETQVLVNNGDTLVIGGVFDRRLENTVDKVPFLGDIPVIGSLFRRTVKADTKSELLVFITPKILEDQFTTQYAE